MIDVKDPLNARIRKIIEPEEEFKKAGYSRPHTVHCGPEGNFILGCEIFEILGCHELDHGSQDRQYDLWWNLPRDYTVSSG